MINPDGVFYGNYRTNLSGNDMNRKWRTPSKSSQPEIYYLKRFLCEVNRVNPIVLIIDFHGHSRK
jgi:murein tripeptide amidase MpaA